MVLLVVAIPLVTAWVSSYLHQPLPLTEPSVVEVPRGAGLSQVLHALKNAACWAKATRRIFAV